MKRGKNKAQAGIITAVLLIIISIVAVAIVWNIVSPMIKKNLEEGQKTKFIDFIEIQEVKTDMLGNSKITVHRGNGEGTMTGLKFIFYDKDGNSKTIERDDNLLQDIGSRMFEFNSSQLNLGNKLSKVSMQPVFEDSIGNEINEPDFRTDSNNNRVLELPYGLRAWLKFDGNMLDRAGNYFAYCNNTKCPQLTTDRFGNPNRAYLFDGVDDYVRIDNFYPTANSYTFSFWLNVLNKSAPKLFFNHGGNPGLQYIKIVDDGRIINVHGANPYGSIITANTIINKGWMNYVVTWDGINMYTYINGAKENVTQAGNAPVVTGSGYTIIGSNNGVSYFYNGSIDDVMIFNRSLSADEVRSLYLNQNSL